MLRVPVNVSSKSLYFSNRLSKVSLKIKIKTSRKLLKWGNF